jgi:AmmeMemoRadiSam system protein B
MDLRPSPIAGRWYSGQATQLIASVDEDIHTANLALPGGPVVGVIAPHAGHLYSGGVAGHAFKAVHGTQFDVVAVLCPSHFHDDGPLLTSGHAAYHTPLGDVPVARETLAQLRAALAPIPLVAIRHDREHAIEIEVPFLQRALMGEFQLLPIMMRDQSAPVARALGQALAEALTGHSALIVGSSDLAHFLSQAETERLDAELLKHIAAFDPEGVLRAHESGRGFACGHGAIAATLWAARALGATRARVVKHATSGDVSGDYDSVVGYGAAVLWKE